MIGRRVLGGAAAFCLLALLTGELQAQTFYQGKTINFLVGGGAGGNADIDARMIVRFMGKLIDGKPRTIVRNLESGSGGMVSINHFGELSRKDGTEVLIGTVGYTTQLLGNPALRVKYSDLLVVGGFGQPSVVHIRKDMPPGIEKPEDLFKVTTPIKSAGYVVGHDVDLHLLLTMDMLKVPHQHVTGFHNSPKMHLALLQGEVQMGFDSAAGYRTRIESILIKPGISIPLWQSGIPQEDGSLKASAGLPGIPTFLDVYKLKFGQDSMPPADLWEAYRLITQVRANLVRAIFLPPGAPQAALTALRQAWAKTAENPEFIAEYEKIYQSAPDISLGEEGEESLKSGEHANQAALAVLKKYAE